MGHSELVFFGGFLLLILSILLVDLGVFSKNSHVVGFKEALVWTGVWVSLALGFYLFLNQYGELIHGIENSGQLSTQLRRYRHDFLLSGDFARDMDAYRHNLSLEFITGYL